MSPPNSQDTFREAGHQGMDALRNAGHGFADFGHAISDAWGVGVKLNKAAIQVTSEAGQAVGHAAGRVINAAGAELARENRELVHGAQEIGHKVAHGAHVVGQELQREERVVVHGAQDIGRKAVRGVHAAGEELARENKELVHGAQEIGHKVAHGAHVVGKELQREERAVVHGAAVAGEAVAHPVQAGAKRIGDHIHDRPLTAAMEALVCPPLAIIDGLARGGIEKSHDQLARNHGAEIPAHHQQKNPHTTHLPNLEIKH